MKQTKLTPKDLIEIIDVHMEERPFYTRPVNCFFKVVNHDDIMLPDLFGWKHTRLNIDVSMLLDKFSSVTDFYIVENKDIIAMTPSKAVKQLVDAFSLLQSIVSIHQVVVEHTKQHPTMLITKIHMDRPFTWIPLMCCLLEVEISRGALPTQTYERLIEASI